jgi:hypothetical protein
VAGVPVREQPGCRFNVGKIRASEETDEVPFEEDRILMARILAFGSPDVIDSYQTLQHAMLEWRQEVGTPAFRRSVAAAQEALGQQIRRELVLEAVERSLARPKGDATR